MKDFSKTYGAKIANAILKKYSKNKGYCKALSAYIIGTGGKSVLAIRPNEDANYFGIVPEAAEAFREIVKFSEMVETYPGELTGWTASEEQRIYNFARDMILKRIA